MRQTKGIACRLANIAKRFVDHRARLERKERLFGWLTVALRTFLKRDDLTESARVEAEALQIELDEGLEV
ncbi:MAG: hypothetical protein ABF285_15330 [Pacificibacter sp.]|uniref:hypothetical protein n=1 Tax=Pacificibacter sp. TaxID=1917866 RepID=UPI00321A10B6